MIERIHPFALMLIAILTFSTATFADEAQDALVESGINAYEDGDFERAKAILLPLAETSHSKAINVIGIMHDNGNGFPTNPGIACNLYERSARLGYPSAMYNLSHCFNEGHGRPLDSDAATKWIIKAAENGLIQAMLHLAIEASETEADRRYWLKRASDSGSKYAAAALWLDGHKEDAPDFSFLDSICVRVRILTLHHGVEVCDD